MDKFLDNFKYIVECLESIKKKSVPFVQVGNFFGISKANAHAIYQGKVKPRRPKLDYFANVLKREFGWKITGEMLGSEDISKSFDISHLLNDKEESFSVHYIEDYEKELIKTGSRIKELRQKKGLSLRDLAQQIEEIYPQDSSCHSSASYISYIERGNILNFQMKKILAITNGLNTSLEYLLFGRDKKNTITIDHQKERLVIPIDIKKLPSDSKQNERIIKQIIKAINNLQPDIIIEK